MPNTSILPFAGADLAEITLRLAGQRPEAFLVLADPVQEFLVSPDGLGIDAADLLTDALEYLSLLVFLRGEADIGNLPYRDFAEKTRAAHEGSDTPSDVTCVNGRVR